MNASNFLQERHLLLFNNSDRKLILLTEDKYKIGRDLSNEIVLNCDPISRIHARLERIYENHDRNFKYQISDGASQTKSSKNGIFINDIRCESHILQSGDIISFANIIKSIYIQATLSEFDLERFREELAFDHCKFNSFLDDKTAIAVEANLSNPEYTTIMLGGLPFSSKGTVTEECSLTENA